MPLYAITGSATVDGRPIYRDAAGGWTDQIQRAAVFEAEADRDAQVQAAQREERVGARRLLRVGFGRAAGEEVLRVV